MSFVRPEVRAILTRWQGVLGGAALVAGGAWAIVALGGAAAFLGVGAVLAGIAIGWPAWQRARFSPEGDGTGLVELTEAQLAYWHPRGGGALSLDSVRLIEIRVLSHGEPARPVPFWAFHHEDGPPLVIPANAAGAERLIDVLARFPGASTDRVIAAGHAAAPAGFTIWRRADTQAPALPRTPPPA